MAIIKDPVFGTGVRVGKDGRLRARVVQQTQESEAARNGDAFVASTSQGAVRTLTLATVQTYALLLLQNNSPTRVLVLDSIAISASVAGAILFITKNPTVGVLTNNVGIEPANRNYASNDLSDVDAQIWDEVGTVGIAGLTLGEEIQSLILPSTILNIPLGSSVHLGRTNTTLISIENPTGGAIEVTASMRFHMEEEGDGLA